MARKPVCCRECVMCSPQWGERPGDSAGPCRALIRPCLPSCGWSGLNLQSRKRRDNRCVCECVCVWSPERVFGPALKLPAPSRTDSDRAADPLLSPPRLRHLTLDTNSLLSPEGRRETVGLGAVRVSPLVSLFHSRLLSPHFETQQMRAGSGL